MPCAALMPCSGVFAPAMAARAFAMSPNTVCSWPAAPFTVSTRLPMSDARRWSWLSTCAHLFSTSVFLLTSEL